MGIVVLDNILNQNFQYFGANQKFPSQKLIVTAKLY